MKYLVYVSKGMLKLFDRENLTYETTGEILGLMRTYLTINNSTDLDKALMCAKEYGFYFFNQPTTHY